MWLEKKKRINISFLLLSYMSHQIFFSLEILIFIFVCLANIKSVYCFVKRITDLDILDLHSKYLLERCTTWIKFTKIGHSRFSVSGFELNHWKIKLGNSMRDCVNRRKPKTFQLKNTRVRFLLELADRKLLWQNNDSKLIPVSAKE